MQKIRQWLTNGFDKGATHMIVVRDTWDYTCYPVYVLSGQNVKEVFNFHNNMDMERVIKVYSYAMDIEKQLAEHEVFNF